MPLLHKAERFVVDLAEESLPEGHPRAPGAADAAASESRLWGEHLAALEAGVGSSGVRLEQAAGAVEVGLTPLLLARRDASYLISNAKEMPTVNHHDARVSRFTEELFWYSAARITWLNMAQSRCRCDRDEPSPGADVAGMSPVPVRMWQG